MWVWIVLSIVIYLTIGCIHVGFIDLKFCDDLPICLFVIFCWPVVWILLAVCHAVILPVRLGKRLGDKVRPNIDNYLDKLFGEE